MDCDCNDMANVSYGRGMSAILSREFFFHVDIGAFLLLGPLKENKETIKVTLLLVNL